jgi:hypothetical protein
MTIDAITNCDGGQEVSSALKEIHISELRQATLSLGLQVGQFDLQWDTFVAQFNLSLQRLQAENIDATSFVLLHQMLDHTRATMTTIKNAVYLALTDLLHAKDNEEFLKRQKREKNLAKAAARMKRKLAEDNAVPEKRQTEKGFDTVE